MKTIGTVVGVVAALVLAFPAEAQVSLDLKVGYAIPTGNAAASGGVDVYHGAMNHMWSGAVPVEVAGRYRFSPNLSAGVYFQYDPALVATWSCTSGLPCSGYDMRVGVEVAYAFLPDRFLNPWVSVGTGWEWTHLYVTDNVLTNTITFSGWEYFNVQAGLDFNLSRMFAIGPYVGYFGGSYTSVSGDLSGSGVNGSIPSEFRSFHGWIQFGAKGTVNL
jgi:hypothetical protein